MASAPKKQAPLWKEVDDMNDKELMEKLIQQYTVLQRIITAADPRKEAEYQSKVVKAKLEAFSVVTEDLNIH